MDPIPATVLGAVKGGVRPCDQPIDRRDRFVGNSGTDADGGTDCVSRDGCACSLKAGTDAFGDLACALQAAWNDCDEFFAAESGDDVVGARARSHYLSEHTQGGIADTMAKADIDRLEVIEIEHQHRDRLVPLGLQGAQGDRIFEEGAPAKEPGQVIGAEDCTLTARTIKRSRLPVGARIAPNRMPQDSAAAVGIRCAIRQASTKDFLEL